MSRIKCDKVNVGSSYVVQAESYTREIELERNRNNILENAKAQAQELINQANQQAAEIIEKAKTEAMNESGSIREEAKKLGYQEGYDTGYEDGTKKITEEMEEKVVNVDNFAKSTFDIKKRIIKSAHKDIVELICNISNKICHKSLEIDTEIISKITEDAIKSLKEKEEVNIIVNPKMAEKLWEISDEFKEKIKGLENIKIIEDPSVSSDGTIVESISGRVDSTINTQIQTITDELMNTLKSTSEEELIKEIDDDKS